MADAQPSPAELARRFAIGPRKSLGQNFLYDQRLIARIAAVTGPLDGVNVVEIGPGPGGLTQALLAGGARRVVAVERDPRCVAALQGLAEAASGRLEIASGDALAIDAADLVPPPRRLIANLPYNIATPLLLGWLRQASAWQSFGLMFQKEVAQRIVASPDSDHYGRLAIVVQWLCEARIAFDVPPGAFRPSPKVTSTVVALVPRPSPLAPCSFAELEQVTAAAFGQRRKMLRSSLKTLKVDAAALCAAANVRPTDRAEVLDIPAFCALARALPELRSGDAFSG